MDEGHGRWTTLQWINLRSHSVRWNAWCKALPFEIESETPGTGKKLAISSRLSEKQSIDRLSDDRWTIRATEWTPRDWTRKQGRPKTRWRDKLTRQIGPLLERLTEYWHLCHRSREGFLSPNHFFVQPDGFLLLKSTKMKVYKAKGYLISRVSPYPNSTSTFQISCLIINGDISENPGPSTNKLICPECSRTIAKNHRSLTCSVCDLTYHIKCECATLKDFKLFQRIVPMIWKCLICLHDISFDLNELPFASLSEESFNSMMRTDPLYNESSQCDSNSDHLHEFAQEINTLPKGSSTRMLYRDRLETIENSQSTNSAKTLKIFNVYSSLGL